MKSEMFHSATIKLTAWYMVIVTAICLVFSVVLYHFSTNTLANGLNHQSQRFSNEFPVFDNDPYFRRPGGELNNGAHQLIKKLVLFDVVVLVAAGFGSYALAKRTLHPIKEAHEQQTRFTADVSHELRTPLTAIKMESEVALMDSTAGKPAFKEALRSNLEEANKLELLINSLLKLTKLEASELQQAFRPVALPDVLNDALANVLPKADSRHITIEANIKDAVALGDEASLTQLFTILLDNAVKYSKDKKTVTMSSHVAEDQAVVIIQDEGIGIEPQALTHIFERFYRADKARTHTSAGTSYGLGLSIAKQISDMHNGTIVLTSRPGHGTKAIVKLPLAPVKKTS